MNDDIRDKVQQFFISYPEVHYPKGQILILQNELPEKVFYIISGRVCQYDISYRGDEVIVNTFKPPAFFPMAMVINEIPSKFFYKTEADTVVRIASAKDVIKFLHEEPDVTYDLLSRVYSGIEAVLERTVRLMSGTAKSRLIFELIIEFRRFGNKDSSSGYLEVTEASIASRSGLSRETVSREIGHLKEKGLVDTKTHHIFIPDISALEKLLGSHT